MEKIYKATMRAFGAKPNGSDKTSCVNDAQHVKQILMLLGVAFTAGAVTFGYKGMPIKVRIIEDKVLVIEQKLSVLDKIDYRLERIENRLMERQYDSKL
jgi:hypothetical protein